MRRLTGLVLGLLVVTQVAAAPAPEIPDWMQVTADGSAAAWEHSVHFEKGVRCIACHGRGDEPLSVLKGKVPQRWDADEAARIKPKKRAEYDALCVRCHEGARRNFLRTFHGKHARLGKGNIPTCSYCHVGHEPALASRANALHPDTLGRVCAGCHAGATEPAKAVMAANLTGPATGDTLYGRDVFGLGPLRVRHLIDAFYSVLLAGVLGFVLFWIAIDWRVAREDRKRAAAGAGKTVRRFTAGQRVQHLLLALSFITLALTGFAIKYPDSGYAQWLVPLLGGADNRSLVHRLAALVFVGNGLFHFVYYLLFYRGPRPILWSRDDWQAARMDILFRLGRGERPVESGKYDWLQKLEYWAGVIGWHVVLVTGLLMWFFEWALSHLPYQVFKYAQWIHGWEAILATSVVALLHGYATMFNPRVFPMDWSWITGRRRV